MAARVVTCFIDQLKLQTYQSISPVRVREKPPANVQNRENGVRREGKLPSLAENAVQKKAHGILQYLYPG